MLVIKLLGFVLGTARRHNLTRSMCCSLADQPVLLHGAQAAQEGGTRAGESSAEAGARAAQGARAAVPHLGPLDEPAAQERNEGDHRVGHLGRALRDARLQAQALQAQALSLSRLYAFARLTPPILSIESLIHSRAHLPSDHLHTFIGPSIAALVY